MSNEFDQQYFRQINSIDERLKEHTSILKALTELFLFASETKIGLGFKVDTFYGISRIIEIFLDEQNRIIEDEIENQKGRSEYAVNLAESYLAGKGNIQKAEAIRRLKYVISCMGAENESKAVQLLARLKSESDPVVEPDSLSNNFRADTINISQTVG